jgi:hypothetical protein
MVIEFGQKFQSCSRAVTSFDEKQSLIGSAGHSMAKAGKMNHICRGAIFRNTAFTSIVSIRQVSNLQRTASVDDYRLYMNVRDTHRSHQLFS